ncbi:hypothetical protein K7432_003331 [Basidiobolus ranarum]|uniref:PAS domain-containing protein n=1 Tax=Basidiobolus ranarum TaxID=34480 RepID=A0ABR2W6C8_9FUNG
MPNNPNSNRLFFDVLCTENPETILKNERSISSKEFYNEPHQQKSWIHRLHLNHKLFLICLTWFIVFTILGAIVFVYCLNLDHERHQNQILQSCAQKTTVIKSVVSQLSYDLASYVYFIDSVKQSMTAEIFIVYSELMDRNGYDYIYGWHPRVLHAERAEWEKVNNCSISAWETDTSVLARSEDKPMYFPLKNMNGSGVKLKGLDALQTPQRDYIEQTIATRNASFTMAMYFSSIYGDGVRMYIPITTSNESTAMFSDQKNDISNGVEGIVTITVRIESIQAKITPYVAEPTEITIRVTDKSNGTLLYSDSTDEGQDQLPEIMASDMMFLGCEWLIQCFSQKSDYTNTKTPAILLLVIILCIISSTVLLFVYVKRYLKARKQIFVGNKLLQYSNALVKNMATNSKAILLSITDPLLLFDRNGKITGANTYALSKTGYTSEDVRASEDLYIGDVINITQRPNDVSCLVIEPGMREVTITCKDGTHYYAEANFSGYIPRHIC